MIKWGTIRQTAKSAQLATIGLRAVNYAQHMITVVRLGHFKPLDFAQQNSRTEMQPIPAASFYRGRPLIRRIKPVRRTGFPKSEK